MRTEKNNRIRKSYIMVAVMIILQVILIYGVLSDIEYGNINALSNEVVVEDTQSLYVFNNNLLTQNSGIKIEVGKITLIGILMIGTGLLLATNEKETEENPEK